VRDAPISFFQQRIAILATGAATNGAVGAVEVTTPRGSAPPLHIHHREDEAFYVLEGSTASGSDPTRSLAFQEPGCSGRAMCPTATRCSPNAAGT
jgi:hypothetical protein